VLDHGLLVRGECLLPVEGGAQRPARRQVPLHALAGVVFLNLSKSHPDNLVLLVTRQPVERLAGGEKMGRQRHAKPAQSGRAVNAAGKHPLLDLRCH
jgi:hypothetical protein